MVFVGISRLQNCLASLSEEREKEEKKTKKLNEKEEKGKETLVVVLMSFYNIR